MSPSDEQLLRQGLVSLQTLLRTTGSQHLAARIPTDIALDEEGLDVVRSHLSVIRTLLSLRPPANLRQVDEALKRVEPLLR